MVRAGHWGNTLVRADAVRSGQGMRGDPRRADLLPHSRPFDQVTSSRRVIRELENEKAIGWMRNPLRSVRLVPGLRPTGARIRQVIEKFIDLNPTILDAIDESIAAGWCAIDAASVDRLAKLVGAELGASECGRSEHSLWRAGLVDAFIKEAGDPDQVLAGWLQAGAPTGVAHDISSAGVFPVTEAAGIAHDELWRQWARAEPMANYASVDEHKDLVKTEIRRLRDKGFVTLYPNWQAVKERFGNAVVSKMAALTKVREDGSTKLRLIIDMRRSFVNAHVRCHERIVLPRIQDMLEDTLGMLEVTTDPSELEMMVVDWEDAFRSIGVLPEELPHQVVRGFDGTFIGYETILFGGAGSPNVWGRAAAFLGRSGQSLFEETEARLQVYVDDPWCIWRGSAAQRRRNRAVLLLWWAILGPPISWRKMQIGVRIKWIGVLVVLAGGQVSVTLDPTFLRDLAREIGVLRRVQSIPPARLKKLAGKAEWAAGIIPYLKPMISPLWSAASDTQGDWVGQRRVEHALGWLASFFSRRRGTLTRSYAPKETYGEELVAEFDASPWGYGGALCLRGQVVKFFGEPITQEDVRVLDVTIGDAKGQAILETMAIVIGLRSWGHLLCRGRWCLRVRSDSQAALGAAFRLRSRNPIMNMLIRELALDLAEGKYELKILEHLPGTQNTIADDLSRLHQPGASGVLPPSVAKASRTYPAPRDASWWTAYGPTEENQCRSCITTTPGTGSPPTVGAGIDVISAHGVGNDPRLTLPDRRDLPDWRRR